MDAQELKETLQLVAAVEVQILCMLKERNVDLEELKPICRKKQAVS